MNNNKYLFKALKYSLILASCFIGYLLLKYVLWIFVFDTFRVPTGSMKPTLVPGDKIFVNKLPLGARLYTDLDSAVSSYKPSTYRAGGWRNVRRNDVLVFNFPVPRSWSRIEFEINRVYCKRCVAIGGDTISIVNGYIHNSSTSERLGYYPGQQELSTISDSVLMIGAQSTFPYNTLDQGWTLKNFGPLYVPKKGSRITLDTMNYTFFRLAIEYETEKTLSKKSSDIFLGDSLIREYTFTENYYFMLGDNMAHSQDSRYWGFVPEKHIIGVVSGVLYHRDPISGDVGLHRMFRSIDKVLDNT